MKGTIVVALMKLVQSNGVAKPQNPAFQIGCIVFVDKIMRDAEPHTTYGSDTVKVRH